MTKHTGAIEHWDATTGARLECPAPHEFDKYECFRPRWQDVGRETLDEALTNAVGNHFNGWSDLVKVSPDGRYVAFGSLSGYLGVFDIVRRLPLILDGHTTSMNNHMHQNSINALLFDCSSTYLMSSAEEDGEPLLWDLTAEAKQKRWNQVSGRLLDQPLRLQCFLPGPFDSFAFSPVEAKFVTTHRAMETAAIWEIVKTP